ncbi:hypothetical protein Ahy_B01g057104 isoform A [Arachis hypogaea]|uniref:Aminotransferase-like plant mobile domain-containing protein n=3 Tax=Arachis hypogaea TaxID=3818 RepID=A0A445B0B4_ARAHY|nr:hypothetical protein Ahy_B01g057104 isoform A [Arachis hypogaea]
MEDERRLYRLDGVAHVDGTIDEEPTRCVYSVRRQQNMPLHDRIIPYLERDGLYHLTRLNAHWFWLDEPLVSAFIERWRPETHTFHMPFGECTITLQDVAYQLGLPVDGQAVSGSMTNFHCTSRGPDRHGSGSRSYLVSFRHWIRESCTQSISHGFMSGSGCYQQMLRRLVWVVHLLLTYLALRYYMSVAHSC